jgi:ribosomal protein L24E
MTLAKCTFCGKEQEDHRGTYFIKNDGAVLYFSSSKCMKNHFRLKRDKRKVRWTEAFHLARKKRQDKVKMIAEKETEKMNEVKKGALKKVKKVIKKKSVQNSG